MGARAAWLVGDPYVLGLHGSGCWVSVAAGAPVGAGALWLMCTHGCWVSVAAGAPMGAGALWLWGACGCWVSVGAGVLWGSPAAAGSVSAGGSLAAEEPTTSSPAVFPCPSVGVVAGARRQAQGASDTLGCWGGRLQPRHPAPGAPGGEERAPSSPWAGCPATTCAMRRGRTLGAWVLVASLAVVSWGVRGQKVKVKEASGKVFLHCETSSRGPIIWLKNGDMIANATQLDLGTAYDDPRGTYACETENGKTSPPFQVHYRMCQNCIEVDAPTISGIVVADVVATIFLAVAVYCITGQDKGRMSRASDRQNLIANEQLYQPLGERDDEQYSQLAPAKARK
uniref:CD3 gamma/delta subunit Ig-like domain-containing protein n=1 Tax=Falco tinnunculus TaxID=100819 RepID=A0A8C4UW96_FALTI